MTEERPIVTPGERMRLLRFREGWNLAELATSAGVRIEVWRRLEADEDPRATEREQGALRPFREAAERLEPTDGERCRVIRERLGLTIAQAASTIYVSRASVLRIERGVDDGRELLYKLREIYYS